MRKISLTCQTTKNELIKKLQHFALIIRFYTNVISTQNVVNFWRYIWPNWFFPVKDIITKKDSSSSTMSFTNLTTKTELVKNLQHLALIVKFYTNLILTQNVVNFLKTYFALFVLSNERYCNKKKTVQVRWCHLQAKPRKQNSLKSYNILRYKFLRHILSYSSFPLTDIYEMKPV